MPTMQVKKVIERVKDFPGLGERIKAARMADKRSLSKICKEWGISRAYWYQLEDEDMRAPATIEMIRKIEQALGVDLGVQFDD